MKKALSLVLATVLCCSLAGCGSSSGGGGSSLPKNIEVQVPASAGGGTDVVARALTTYINQNGGTNMTIINNTDGSGVVAMETVRTGKADGSSILFFHTTMAIKTATGLYDHRADTDFKVIGVAQPSDPGGYVLVVPAESGITDLDGYIEAAKAAGGSYMIGIETGGSSHLMAGIMSKALGIELNYVEAGSDTDKLTSLVGGNIDSALVNGNQAKQYVEAGMVNALACFSTTSEGGRTSVLPDVPSFVEQGYDCTFATNFYVLANPEMSDDTAKAILDLFTAAANDEETQGILQGAGMGATFVPYEEGKGIITAQQDQLNAVCEELGLVK